MSSLRRKADQHEPMQKDGGDAKRAKSEFLALSMLDLRGLLAKQSQNLLKAQQTQLQQMQSQIEKRRDVLYTPWEDGHHGS